MAGSKHYTDKAVQPWDAMASWMTTEEFRGFLRGNVIKYICRYRDKDGVEDLLKCEHYLQTLIKLESKEIDPRKKEEHIKLDKDLNLTYDIWEKS